MITEDKRFIDIQGILAMSDVRPADCIKINDLIIELSKENQELKEDLHKASIGIQELIEQDIECPSNCSKLKEILNQQKKFIEYLENMLDNENDIFSVVRVKDVLSKYKKIIGGKDEIKKC